MGRQVVDVASQLDWHSIYLTFVIGAIGLTAKQRQKILERDNHECQHPDNGLRAGPKGKDGKIKLQVHHIQAKGFEEARGIPPQIYNDPANLISLSEVYHVAGGPKCKHPDIHQAHEDYRNGDKQAISKVLTKHHDMAQKGEKYWNQDSDVELHKKAAENNKKMDEKHGGRSNWWPWNRKP